MKPNPFRKVKPLTIEEAIAHIKERGLFRRPIAIIVGRLFARS